MPIEFTQESQPTGSFALNYFGARYFDPFFGLWMSPDPAGQYANPYTYGGDPVNFIDPTGLFGLNTGFFTIGWDSNRGWNFGMSAGIFSYTWYQNGSKTFEATIGGSYQWYFLNLGGSIGYSYNTYSGHSLSAGGHVCVGAKEDEAGVCAGLEAGANMYWDAYGNFLGATAYAGPFAELQASDNTSLVKVNGGYETGLFGMEGRGWYTGASSAMDRSLYANASWSQNGGWNYGGSYKVNWHNYGNGVWSFETMGYTLQFGSILKADLNLAKNASPLYNGGERGKFDEDGYYVVVGHGGRNVLTNEPVIVNEQMMVGVDDEIAFLKKNGLGDSEKNRKAANKTIRGENAEALAEQIQSDPNYKPGQAIKLQSCANASLARELSKLIPNTDVMGPTTNVVVDGFWNLFTKRGYFLEDNGTWNTYRNGSLVSTKAGGLGAEAGW